MTRVGWIGLGAMGGPMAACLATAGHTVAAYDIDLQRAKVLTEFVVQRRGGFRDCRTSQPRYSPGTLDVAPHSMLQYATPDWITSTLSIRPPQPGQSATTLRSPPARATLRGSLATSSELDL